MRDALQSRDQIRAANTAAHQRHLTVTRMRYRRRGPGLDHGRDTGIDI